MSDNGKDAVGIILAAGLMVAAVIGAIAWPVNYYAAKENIEAMEKGYEQGPVPTGTKTGWVKVKK